MGILTRGRSRKWIPDGFPDVSWGSSILAGWFLDENNGETAFQTVF